MGLAPRAWRGRDRAVGSTPPDYSTGDRRLFVYVAESHGGTRDLRASVVQLALHAHAHPDARGVLLVQRTRMSGAGLRAEWNRLLAVLEQDLAARLGLVALLDDSAVVVPDEPTLRGIADAAAKVRTGSKRARVDRSFEVMRVLMARWLLRRGRIAIGELGRQAGLSHPSVSKALASLGDSVERKPDRSAILRALPHEQWARLLALAPSVRQTTAFVASWGHAADPRQLLERLADLRPAGIAVGGVVAARHWHPGLDLDGLPRLDISVHAQGGQMDARFVEELDPVLVPAPAGASPLLVLHAVPRAESLFTSAGEGGLPIADPVEVLLDLHELRLVEQAEALVRALRGTR